MSRPEDQWRPPEPPNRPPRPGGPEATARPSLRRGRAGCRGSSSRSSSRSCSCGRPRPVAAAARPSVDYSAFLDLVEAGPRRPRSTTRARAGRSPASSRVTSKSTARSEFTTQGQPDGLPDQDVATLTEHNVGRNYKPAPSNWLSSFLIYLLPFVLLGRVLHLDESPRAGPDGRGDEHRAVARQGLRDRQAEDDVRRRRRLRPGQGRDHRGRRLPEAARQVQGHRRAHPEGRAARRPARYRQDADRACRRR